MRGRVMAWLAVLALVAAACGDSGDGTTTTDAGGDDTVEITEAAGGDTTTTTSGDDGDTTTTGGDTGDLGDLPGTAGDVGELLERFQETRIRATYRLDQDGSDSTLTISQDPTADPPVSAIISEEDGFQIIYSGDAAMTMCDASEGTCFAVPVQPGTDPSLFAGAFLTPFLSSFLAFTTADTVGFDVDTEPVEVAGRSGVCFTVTPDDFVGADFDEVRQCIDDETGAILLFDIKEVGGEFERVMELLEFGEPLASDFEAPFPMVELPTG